jgi:ribosomal protein S27E
VIDYERQAITSTARLPRHPGPRAVAVRCAKCDKVLGVRDGGHLFVRHNGREATYSLPAEVRCERCGGRTLLLDSNLTNT